MYNCIIDHYKCGYIHNGPDFSIQRYFDFMSFIYVCTTLREEFIMNGGYLNLQCYMGNEGEWHMKLRLNLNCNNCKGLINEAFICLLISLLVTSIY